MSKILAVHGLIGSGKDTMISFIKAHLNLYNVFKNATGNVNVFHELNEAIKEKDNHNWSCSKNNIVIERFAKPIKSLLASFIGCTEEDLNSQEFKQKHLPIIFNTRNWNTITVREFHTIVGDGLKELFNYDIFGSSCLYRSTKHIKNGVDLVIINDLRYEDLELPYCIANNAYLVKITRVTDTNNDYAKHSSELGIPSLKFNMVIRNDGSYEDLFINTSGMLHDAGIVSYEYNKYIREYFQSVKY